MPTFLEAFDRLCSASGYLMRPNPHCVPHNPMSWARGYACPRRHNRTGLKAVHPAYISGKHRWLTLSTLSTASSCTRGSILHRPDPSKPVSSTY